MSEKRCETCRYFTGGGDERKWMCGRYPNRLAVSAKRCACGEWRPTEPEAARREGGHRLTATEIAAVEAREAIQQAPARVKCCLTCSLSRQSCGYSSLDVSPGGSLGIPIEGLPQCPGWPGPGWPGPGDTAADAIARAQAIPADPEPAAKCVKCGGPLAGCVLFDRCTKCGLEQAKRVTYGDTPGLGDHGRTAAAMGYPAPADPSGRLAELETRLSNADDSLSWFLGRPGNTELDADIRQFLMELRNYLLGKVPVEVEDESGAVPAEPLDLLDGAEDDEASAPAAQEAAVEDFDGPVSGNNFFVAFANVYSAYHEMLKYREAKRFPHVQYVIANIRRDVADAHAALSAGLEDKT